MLHPEPAWESECGIIQNYTVINLTGTTIKQEFTIEYSRPLNYGPKDAELTVDVFFDGKFSDGWIAPDPEPRARKVSGEIRGSRRGNELHHFVFSEPEIIGAS